MDEKKEAPVGELAEAMLRAGIEKAKEIGERWVGVAHVWITKELDNLSGKTDEEADR